MLDDGGQPIFQDVATNQPCCMDKACNEDSYYIDPKIDENDNRTYYDRLVMQNKPMLGEFQTLLDSWKDKKTKEINWERRVCDLPERQVLARKCGFNKSNFSKHIHKLIKGRKKPAMVSFVECMESKVAERQAEKDSYNAKVQEFKDAKQYIKGFDCSILGAFNRRVCIMLKGR